MADALLIFKPDAAYRLAARAGIWRWLSTEREWKVESLDWFQPPASLTENHYDFLQGRPFFPWLVDFMTALPVAVGRVTASAESLMQMRYDLGETQIAKSRPGSLREHYGIFGGLNCLHLSDAPETGDAEVKRWSQFVQLDAVKVRLEEESEKPDHTYHLRSLATQVANGIHVERAMQQRHLLYDRAGDQHYDIVSALIKSVRGSDPDAAVYWMARMLEAGEDVMFVARRLVILAAEDIGLADPQALPVAVAAQQAAHFVGMPEAVLPLTEAALYLALAPKSNSALTSYGAARELIQETGNEAVPLHLRNAPTGLMKSMGYGRGYKYAHDEESGVADQVHMPEKLQGRKVYAPNPRDRKPGK